MTAHRLLGPAFVLPDELPCWLCPAPPPKPPELAAREVKILSESDKETEEWLRREDELKRVNKRARERDRRRRIAAAEIAAGRRAANHSERAKKGAATKARREAEKRKKERAAFYKTLVPR